MNNNKLNSLFIIEILTKTSQGETETRCACVIGIKFSKFKKDNTQLKLDCNIILELKPKIISKLTLQPLIVYHI